MLQQLLFNFIGNRWTASLTMIVLSWFTSSIQAAEPLATGEWISVTDEKVVTRSSKKQQVHFVL